MENEKLCDREISISDIEKALELHESMRNAYFFTSPNIASCRRNYEDSHSLFIAGIIKTEKRSFFVEIECNTTCSCRNVYYHGNFEINGRKVNALKLKTFLKKIKENKSIPESYIPVNKAEIENTEILEII